MTHEEKKSLSDFYLENPELYQAIIRSAKKIYEKIIEEMDQTKVDYFINSDGGSVFLFTPPSIKELRIFLYQAPDRNSRGEYVGFPVLGRLAPYLENGDQKAIILYGCENPDAYSYRRPRNKTYVIRNIIKKKSTFLHEIIHYITMNYTHYKKLDSGNRNQHLLWHERDTEMLAYGLTQLIEDEGFIHWLFDGKERNVLQLVAATRQMLIDKKLIPSDFWDFKLNNMLIQYFTELKRNIDKDDGSLTPKDELTTNYINASKYGQEEIRNNIEFVDRNGKQIKMYSNVTYRKGTPQRAYLTVVGFIRGDQRDGNMIWGEDLFEKTRYQYPIADITVDPRND